MIIHLPEITVIKKTRTKSSNSHFINVPSSDQTNVDRQLKRQSHLCPLLLCSVISVKRCY